MIETARRQLDCFDQHVSFVISVKLVRQEGHPGSIHLRHLAVGGLDVGQQRNELFFHLGVKLAKFLCRSIALDFHPIIFGAPLRVSLGASDLALYEVERT